MLRTKLAGLAGVLFLALAPVGAEAAMVTIRDNPDNGSGVFANGLSRSVDIYSNGNRRVSAGAFGLQFSEDSSTWNDFLTFCLQIDETLSLPRQHKLEKGEDYFTAAQQNAIGILFGNFMTADLGLASANAAAAMQTIVWEVMEDGVMNFDLSAGSFRVRTDIVRNKANELWALVISGNFSAGRVNVFAAAGTQDLITETPLPAGLPLLITGLAGLHMASRRRKMARAA